MNSSIQAEPDSRKSFVFSYGEIVFFFVLIAITKISRKIRTNCKNYNFCVHCRTELTIGRTYYLINRFFFVRYAPGVEITKLKKRI
jgi:hypothetical protein